jgi:Uma2 family endonuclease
MKKMTTKDQHPEPNIVSESSFDYRLEYTYSDYLKFEFEEMVELIRGKIFKMSPAPSTTHQRILGGLHLQIGYHFKSKKCKAFVAPTDVVLPIHNVAKKKSTTVVQPDIFVICDPSKVEEKCVYGVPDLVIEILSRHTRKKDIQLKHEVYQESGVREYWIVFPKDEIIDIFVLEDCKFVLKSRHAGNEVFTSHIFPDLEVDTSDIFPQSENEDDI